jgi:hypothetical protein
MGAGRIREQNPSLVRERERLLRARDVWGSRESAWSSRPWVGWIGEMFGCPFELPHMGPRARNYV